MLCPVCQKNKKSVLNHISKKAGSGCSDHEKYLKDLQISFFAEIDPLLQDFMQIEILEKVKGKFLIISENIIADKIRKRIKEKGLDPRKAMAKKRTGKLNTSCKLEVKKKISESVSDLWASGEYKDRINGMLGRTGINHPMHGVKRPTGKDNHSYKKEVHQIKHQGTHYFNNFLSGFQDIDTCDRCGSDKKINIHHIDENHENFLPSNLEPLCVPCYMIYHYKRSKQPYIVLNKDFWFAGAHQLPNHPKLCQYLHGHEWRLSVAVKKRIDPDTGMVMDFSSLKAVVNNHVISKLDHSCLNDHLINPTAENLLVWIWEQLMFNGLLKGIHRLRLWESRDSCAELNESGMLSVFTRQRKDLLF